MLPKKMNKFRITRTRNSQYSVATLAGNNKTLNSTETLKTLANVRKNLRATILGWQLGFANLEVGEAKTEHTFHNDSDGYEKGVEGFLDYAIRKAKELPKT